MNNDRASALFRRSRTAGPVFACAVVAAVLTNAAATTVAPAPAQALDACVSTGLGTFQTGSASCSSGGPLQWAIAIGANATATAVNGLFNLAIAVGPGAIAIAGGYDDPDLGPATGSFNIARALGADSFALAGGAGNASGDSVGYFNLARALGSGADAEAVNGNFGIARAIGDQSSAVAGLRGNFQVARALGYQTTASAFDGTGQFARALGYKSQASVDGGSFSIARAASLPNLLGGTVGARASVSDGGFGNLARAIGNGSFAETLAGNLNLAWTGLSASLDASNQAYAGHGDLNVAAVWGNGNTARAGDTVGTGNDDDVAIVAGQFSTAIAGPGSHNYVVVIGNNKNQSKPAASSAARRR